MDKFQGQDRVVPVPVSNRAVYNVVAGNNERVHNLERRLARIVGRLITELPTELSGNDKANNAPIALRDIALSEDSTLDSMSEYMSAIEETLEL